MIEEKILPLKLFSILSITLLLLIFVKQSDASDQREEDDIAQRHIFQKKVESQSKEQEPSYGDFDMLSEDALFHHVLPQCNCIIIQVNRSFFTLVTGYSYEHIFDQGFKNRPQRPVSHIISHIVIDFKKPSQKLEQVSSFVWYSLVREVRNISSAYWPYLKKSTIYSVKVILNHLNAQDIQLLGRSLQGTYVQIFDLSENSIGDEGVKDLGQSLKKTLIHTLGLSANEISAKGARDLGQVLKDTHVHTLDLSFNDIGDEGVRDLGEALKETSIHTLDLSINRISNKGARDLGQALKETSIRTLDLSLNDINQKMEGILKEMLSKAKLEF